MSDPTPHLRPAEHPADYVEHMSTPNEAIQLHEGDGRLTVGDAEFFGRVRAEVRWGPRARTEISFVVTAGDLGCASRLLNGEGDTNGRLELDDASLELEVEVHLSSIGTEGVRLACSPKSETRSRASKEKQADALFASLLNFEPIWVRDAPRSQTGRGIVLESESWRVVLEPLPNVSAVHRQLREEGGFALTHGCSVERRHRGGISRQDAVTVLDGLQYFFTFAQGAWAPPLFTMALTGNELVWREWYIRVNERWENGMLSWFNAHEGDALAELFPGFMARWESHCWHDAFRSAIYWYAHSNAHAQGVDGALILAQTGLEQLAWIYVVEDRKLLTADAFLKISAADQIRLLCTSLDIPIEIPAQARDFARFATAENWHDATQAIARVRNGLIHGNPKLRRRLIKSGGAGGVLFQAWNLSLHLYELVLLRLCGFQGRYANRVDLPQMAGKVCRVPWASAASPGRATETPSP